MRDIGLKKISARGQIGIVSSILVFSGHVSLFCIYFFSAGNDPERKLKIYLHMKSANSIQGRLGKLPGEEGMHVLAGLLFLDKDILTGAPKISRF